MSATNVMQRLFQDEGLGTQLKAEIVPYIQDAVDRGILDRSVSLTAVDLNTLVHQGSYNVYNVTLNHHAPVAADAVIVNVIYWGDDNIVQQLRVVHNYANQEFYRISYDNGATWQRWVCEEYRIRSSDIHIYVSKDGSDSNTGLTKTDALLTVEAAIHQMKGCVPGSNGSFFLHFGPGDWGTLYLYSFMGRSARVFVVGTDTGTETTAPSSIASFDEIRVDFGCMCWLRNVDVTHLRVTHYSWAEIQYYNKIGTVSVACTSCAYFPSTAVVDVKVSTVKTHFLLASTNSALHIVEGASFNITEAVAYTNYFMGASNARVVIGNSINITGADQVTGQKYYFNDTILTDANTVRDTLPGTSAGFLHRNVVNGLVADIAIGKDTSDLASERGQIGPWKVKSGIDVNTLTLAGNYHCASNCTNLPTADVYKIIVAQSESFITQLAFTDGALYTRSTQNNSAWTPWSSVSGGGDYLPRSGGNMTGNLGMNLHRIGSASGTYNSEAASRYATSAIEIRENDGVGTAQTDSAYAPAIGFHWANTVAGQLALLNDGSFAFIKQSGAFATVNCTASYATRANSMDGTLVYSGYMAARYHLDIDDFYPTGQNRLGMASNPWGQIYSTNASISTSDERLKENIEDIPDEVLSVWSSIPLRTFRFKEAVLEKGSAAARTHTGYVAQEMKSAFETAGLDPTKYGFFCYDEWDAKEPVEEERDAQGNIVVHADPGREAGNSYSLRYEEALCIEAAAARRRITTLETQVTSLQQEVNELREALVNLTSIVDELNQTPPPAEEPKETAPNTEVPGD